MGNEHYKTAKKNSSYNLFVHYMLMNKTKICPVRSIPNQTCMHNLRRLLISPPRTWHSEEA
jgi:hypothetical protein